MERVRIALQCMNGDGFSPGELQRHVIVHDDRAFTQIVKANERLVSFRLETDENESDTDVIARIASWKLSLVLEPLVENVTVETPLSPKLSRVCDSSGIIIPPSAGLQRSFIYVRHDDIIDFPDQHIKIAVMITIDGTPSPAPDTPNASPVLQHGQDADLGKDEVQVKSSNVDVDARERERPDYDTDSEDEEDGDLSTVRSAKTPAAAAAAAAPAEVTPATSNPTVEPTIGETPMKLANTRDEDVPFSTAPDAITHDAETSDDDEQSDQMESPTAAKAKKMSQDNGKRSLNGDSQAQASANLVSSVNGIPGSDSSDELESFPPVNGKIKYGKRTSRPSDRRQPSKPSTMDASPGITSAEHDPTPSDGADVLSKAQDASDTRAVEEESESGDENRLINPPTSDIPNESGVVREAAIRSVKRKFTDEHDEEESDVSSRRKRRATTSPDSSESIEDGDGGKDDDEQEEDVKPASYAKQGRLPKVARRETEEDADEIAVVKRTIPSKSPGQKKSSPQVMISQPRANTTPSSSTTSTALVGKAPKVLLSKDSPLRKSTGKWLRAQGAQLIDDVQTRRSNFVCVPNAGRLKTAKVLRSLALGKLVVTEDWVTDSKKAGELLDPEEYIPEDLKQTINIDRRKIFAGMNLFFTDALVEKVYKSDWDEVQALAKDAGAKHINSGSSTAGSQSSGRDEVIYLAKDADDADAIRLIKDHGRAVYRKELLTEGILTGELNLDGDEFKLSLGGGAVTKKKKGRR